MRKRKDALRQELATYKRAAGRKRPKRGEPNDRGLDHKVQRMIRRMDPLDLDRLLHDEDE